MSLGFVMMAHTALDRAAAVARNLAEHGCPVAIHVDRRAPDAAFYHLVEQVSGNRLIHIAPRVTCDWGTWSLVEASRSTARLLMDVAPQVRHIYLISGACLPIRPVDELKEYLDSHPTTDFIESVTISEVPWTAGGLSEERFTLSFPFPWKRRRRLFDAWVDIQRRTGLRRSIPEGLEPHMGSQWWCLTRETLERIERDPRRGEFDRYFRRVWIPDESYYATLARRHSRAIESRSLTLSKFDFQGKPHLFYDDHLSLLRQSTAFFARKIWPGARKLYGAFLGPPALARPGADRVPAPRIDRIFADAVVRRTQGRPGLVMAGRFPRQGFENGLTAAPYAVFHGFGDLFEDFPDWVADTLGSRAHGHLFAPGGAEFFGGRTHHAGCLSAAPRLRDYNPEGFLANLIWNTRGEHQAFLFSPRDSQRISAFLARDPNAYVAAVSGAWAVPLLRSGRPVGDIRSEAARLQRREAAHLGRLRERRTRARVRIWTLAEMLEDPATPLQIVTADLTAQGGATGPARLPAIRPIDGLPEFLQELKNAGMNPHTAGEISERRAVHEPPSAEAAEG